MDLNFEGLEMQKWNILTDRSQGVDEKNLGHLSTYYVYLQNYGH